MERVFWSTFIWRSKGLTDEKIDIVVGKRVEREKMMGTLKKMKGLRGG